MAEIQRYMRALYLGLEDPAAGNTVCEPCRFPFGMWQVRRKAEPVKEALQTFVKRWRDDARVAAHPSHAEVRSACMK